MNLLESEGFEVIRSVFFEEELKVLREEADRLAKSSASACVRHIRKKSAIIDDLALSDRILSLLPDGLTPVRSILFDKTSEENWPVSWHQDLTIAVREKVEIEGYGPWSYKDGAVHAQPTEKLLKSMVTVRIHLDSTPASNGALRVIPRSSKKGKIPSKQLLHHTSEPVVVCECEPGDVLLMSPLLLHSSKRSETPERRRIIHFEYAPHDGLDHRLSWFETQTSEQGASDDADKPRV